MSTKNLTATGIKDIWTVLKDEATVVKSSDTYDAQSGYESTLILLGPRSTGKSTLINRFLDKSATDSAPSPTIGLEYTYGRRARATSNVKDVVHLWDLGGGAQMTKLLQVPLTPANVHTASVLVCVDLANPHELVASLDHFVVGTLAARVDEILAGLEKRGSKRPKGLRQFALKKYGAEHADRNAVQPIPIQWALVATKYDVFRDMASELRRIVVRVLRYYAHVKQLMGHYGFKTAAPKATDAKDPNRPVYVPAGTDSLADIFAGTPYKSVEDLKAQLVSLLPKDSSSSTSKGAGNGGMVTGQSQQKQQQHKAFSPQFAEPLIDQECTAFKAGDTVKGTVKVTAAERSKARAIRVKFVGSVDVWISRSVSTGSGSHTETVHDSLDIVETKLTLWGSETHKLLEGNSVLEKGEYTYGYEFKIPEGGPSSIDGSYGGVSYTIQAKIDIAMKSDPEAKCHLSVLGAVDAATLQKYKTGPSGIKGSYKPGIFNFGGGGTIDCHLQLNNGSVLVDPAAPNLAAILHVDNKSTSGTLDQVNIRLRRHVTYTAGWDVREDKDTVVEVKMTGAGVTPGTLGHEFKLSLADAASLLRTFGPSIHTGILNVEYYVSARVGSAKMRLPVLVMPDSLPDYVTATGADVKLKHLVPDPNSVVEVSAAKCKTGSAQ
ncbi:or S-antigen, N-terminal domain-domain-containing protein [Catenaria anguillulae PL171]|uniref:Cytoplasmic dynein 2 light intermediate chain 1 n=1 Tax=Catenaria anguillulae PL171 TaxID=765915 RepID=A0A1Y2HV21_9FUNG|nr:or S-antigen, N-terminal domain-domain-containing protein [Catenaria anguillulae PL171]